MRRQLPFDAFKQRLSIAFQRNRNDRGLGNTENHEFPHRKRVIQCRFPPRRLVPAQQVAWCSGAFSMRRIRDHSRI
jgi:hypothetical protein